MKRGASWDTIHSSSAITLKKALVFKEAIAFKTWRIKLSELKTVSLSRIESENLVNYDDATIYHNDKNPGIS